MKDHKIQKAYFICANVARWVVQGALWARWQTTMVMCGKVGVKYQPKQWYSLVSEMRWTSRGESCKSALQCELISHRRLKGEANCQPKWSSRVGKWSEHQPWVVVHKPPPNSPRRASRGVFVDCCHYYSQDHSGKLPNWKVVKLPRLIWISQNGLEMEHKVLRVLFFTLITISWCIIHNPCIMISHKNKKYNRNQEFESSWAEKNEHI